MSVQELKTQIAGLPRRAQDELMAFLFHIRHADDDEYQRGISGRLGDRDPSRWLSPDEFERELDKREPR